MNINSMDYFPMQVNPSNFNRGDTVKKIITDSVKTPYVGVVTSVIPQTNKVEVQWPSGVSLEDPWDLIKVNPFMEPPVVKQDKAYPTFYNERGRQQSNSLKHYKILEDFISENMKPVVMKAASCFNAGLSKAEAFTSLSSDFDNKEIVKDVLSKVYSNDEICLQRTSEVTIEDEIKTAALQLAGSNDFGFRISFTLGEYKLEESYDNLVRASENFNRIEEILENLNRKQNNMSIVGSVAQRVRDLKASLEDDI